MGDEASMYERGTTMKIARPGVIILFLPSLSESLPNGSDRSSMAMAATEP